MPEQGAVVNAKQQITAQTHDYQGIKKRLLFWTVGKESLARQWAKPQEQFKIAVNAIQHNNYETRQRGETRNAKIKITSNIS